MKQRPLTAEFRLPPTKTIPKPPPGAKAERQRQERAAQKARNLALAHYIDSLIRSGEVADLAAVARMCGVSRARVSKVVGLLAMAGAEEERALGRMSSTQGFGLCRSVARSNALAGRAKNSNV